MTNSQFFLLTPSLLSKNCGYVGLQKMFCSEKCRDPCQDEPCPDPQSSCEVTDHEVQCRGTRRLNVCKLRNIYYSATTTTTTTTTTTKTTTTALTATTTCRTHCDKRKRCSTRRRCDKIRRCEKRHHCEYECIAIVFCSSKNCHYIYDKNCRMIDYNCRYEKYNCRNEEYNCRPICGTG